MGRQAVQRIGGEALAFLQGAVGFGKLRHLLFEFANQDVIVLAIEDLLILRRRRRRREHGDWRCLECFLHIGQQDIVLHRAGNVAGDAEPLGQRFILGIEVGGGIEDERDQAQDGIVTARATEEEAIHDRHQDVGDDQVGRCGARGSQRFGPIGRGDHRIAGRLQHRAPEIELLLVVIDNQDCLHRCSLHSALIVHLSLAFTDMPPRR